MTPSLALIVEYLEGVDENVQEAAGLGDSVFFGEECDGHLAGFHLFGVERELFTEFSVRAFDGFWQDVAQHLAREIYHLGLLGRTVSLNPTRRSEDVAQEFKRFVG